MNYTEVIEKLCEKFGNTMEYLVPKAQAYGIWSNIAEMLIWSAIIVVCVKFFKHLKKKTTQEGAYGDAFVDLEEWEVGVGMVAGIMLIIAIGFAIATIPSIIKWITIPELALIEMAM